MAKTREAKLEYNRVYYKRNRNELLEQKRLYREANRDLLRDKSRQYRATNRDEINKAKITAYYKDREAILERRRQSYVLNRDKQLKQRRLYINANKHRIRKVERKNYNSSPQVRIAKTVRVRINEALKNNSKSARTEELLGINFFGFRLHLESLFKPGMTWENYGYYGWHVDHIIPLASFDLTKPEEQKKAFRYTNTQPLWRSENQKKNAKIFN